MKKTEKDGEIDCLYVPPAWMARHVKQYVISERDGVKSLVCKLAKPTKHIDYDIVQFDDTGTALPQTKYAYPFPFIRTGRTPSRKSFL